MKPTAYRLRARSANAPLGATAQAGLSALVLAAACGTAGSSWMNDMHTADDEDATEPSRVTASGDAPSAANAARFRTRVIGGEEESPDYRRARIQGEELQGKVLGTFRNTYYDFPIESDFQGDAVPLHDARCAVIAEVPRGFQEAICVQGSGILRGGRTVSFAKRDCDCAAICPKTGQKICYDALDTQKFPWGRGALGIGITPLLTVAVDDSIIPMGTGIYIPEYDGAPTDPAHSAVHDGCFIAQDRGLRVKGQHVDIFTGQASITALWNHLVPSNHGVTVILGSPRCSRVATPPVARP